MAKKGRPNKYITNVEPYLDKIEEMASYMTEEQIAEALGVSYSSFRSYKEQYSALVGSLKKGRKNLVIDLKSTLIKKAKGFNYVEKKAINLRTEEGEYITVKEEVYTKYAQPDVAAANLLLKNYDREFWRNDPAEDERKNKELELKEKKIESEDW